MAEAGEPGRPVPTPPPSRVPSGAPASAACSANASDLTVGTHGARQADVLPFYPRNSLSLSLADVLSSTLATGEGCHVLHAYGVN